MEPSNASFRMKLSCLRCRDRKLRCDRGEPECRRCQASSLQCVYPAKRKARGSRQKSEIHRLDHRLEALEERLKVDAPTPASKSSSPPEEATPTNLESGSGADTLLYRMISGAKDSIETLTSQHRLTSKPSSPWAQSKVDSAITRLDSALGQLAVPNPRPGTAAAECAKTSLPTSEIKRCIDTFLHLILPHMTIFDSFTTVVDPDFLRVMPHIVDSPYADVTPVMRVIYYGAIYLGQSMATLQDHTSAIKTYYTCLQAVPKWLESAAGTQLDLLAASLTAWLAINNFDYHLAWQFHCEACRFGDLLGIHAVDSKPPGSPQEEAEKEAQRRLHWYLVEVDFLFRLWYDKPKALRCSNTQVRLPMEISPATKQPKSYNCILFIVWSRALYIIADFFNACETLPRDDLSSKVDHYCNQLAELLEDWDLLTMVKFPKAGLIRSWLYLESVVALYGTIIYMRRRVSSSDQSAHPQAVQAARLITSIIHEWSTKHVSRYTEHQAFSTCLITFYPFCAFFTLYYHILGSTNASECEDDIRILEKLVQLMTETSRSRPDFVPIANAMGVLNDVSRAVHSRQETLQGLTVVCPANPGSESSGVSGRPADTQAPSQGPQEVPPAYIPTFPPLESMQNLNPGIPPQTEGELNGTFGIPFQLQNQVALDWDPASTGETNLARPGTARTVSQPVDFVRAVESELIWRDWHESWWNTGTEFG
ncbi:hypothetical protein BDW62DRAFT_207873 [Aspergillus aurantiobrunneus]